MRSSGELVCHGLSMENDLNRPDGVVVQDEDRNELRIGEGAVSPPDVTPAATAISMSSASQ